MWDDALINSLSTLNTSTISWMVVCPVHIQILIPYRWYYRHCMGTTTMEINGFRSFNNNNNNNNNNNDNNNNNNTSASGIIGTMTYHMATSSYHKLSLFCDMDNTSLVLNCKLCIYWHDNTRMRAGSQWCNVPYESVKHQFIQIFQQCVVYRDWHTKQNNCNSGNDDYFMNNNFTSTNDNNFSSQNIVWNVSLCDYQQWWFFPLKSDLEDCQQLQFDFHYNAFFDQFEVDNIRSDKRSDSFSFISRLTSTSSDTSSRSFLSSQSSNHEFIVIIISKV